MAGHMTLWTRLSRIPSLGSLCISSPSGMCVWVVGTLGYYGVAEEK